jgi:hypothetical protein
MENEMHGKDVTVPTQSEESNLDTRYGKIGISAVAAALHFKGGAKNPAYSPAVPREDERNAKRSELAA